MTGGVARRDGLREAVEALLDDLHTEFADRVIRSNATPKLTYSAITQRLSAVLDAVPDVPPTESHTGDDHCPLCFGSCACFAGDPVVPPDPPAVDRDELAREMATGFHGDGRWEAAAADDGLNEGQRRVWLNIADRVIASGVLVAAADVRARAHKQARDAVDEELRLVPCYGTTGSHHFDGVSVEGVREAVADVFTRLLTDRAVSEREGTT